MTINEQKEYIRRAYNLGVEHAKSGDYCSWYTPRLQMAYDLGCEGIGLDMEKEVIGYRYGDVPSGASYNYAEGRKELGVSCAYLEGGKEIGSSIWFSDREKVAVKGLLIAETGSDDEPLIIPLDMDEQFDF